MTTNPSRKFLISIIILCGSSYMFESQIKVESSILGFWIYNIFYNSLVVDARKSLFQRTSHCPHCSGCKRHSLGLLFTTISFFLKNTITLSMIVMLTNHGTFHVRLQCQTNGSHTTTSYITYIT